VFVFDAKDAKLSTTGASGKATVLVGGKTSEIVLTPDGDNRLVGRGDFSADSGLAAVVRVTMPGQKPLQARFTPLR
jgi:ABC-type hemin transport system substrate-binding protein